MIKIDMEMPRTCSECPFYSGYNRGICLAEKPREFFWEVMSFDATYVTEYRHEDCPLQEVENDA